MTFHLETLNLLLFVLNIVCFYFLLFGMVISVFGHKKRIWPPPNKKSWQFFLTWILFYCIFLINFIFIFTDWNSWIFINPIRFLIAIPMILLGSLLFIWSFTIFGAKNTSGIKDRFVTNGPYRFTRNPQYLGDITLFFGIFLLTNSVYLLISSILLTLLFLITPWAEEVWLEEQYGEVYMKYKDSTPRFL